MSRPVGFKLLSALGRDLGEFRRDHSRYRSIVEAAHELAWT
jgi:hypothetical protein